MTKLYISMNDWEEKYRSSLGRVLVWGAATILAIVMALVGLFWMRLPWLTLLALVLMCFAEYILVRSENTRQTLSWWIKRLTNNDDAVREYAAMVHWQSRSLNLEPIGPLGFRRKVKLADEKDGATGGEA